MNKVCDLHTHSVFSDGTLSPSQIIDAAISKGLSAVALTDHNTIAGLSEFMSYAEDKDIIAVPGIEFSTSYEEKELHILGLFIDEKYFGDINDTVRKVNELKDKSNIDLINALCAITISASSIPFVISQFKSRRSMTLSTIVRLIA